MRATPGYWMYETSGVLRPAVEAYLSGAALSPAQIAALRAYLRQWIAADWHGDGVIALRARIDTLADRHAIARWLADAIDLGIDPL